MARHITRRLSSISSSSAISDHQRRTAVRAASDAEICKTGNVRLGFRMASSCSSQSVSSFLLSDKQSSMPIFSISKTPLISVLPMVSLSVSFNRRYPSLKINCFSSSTGSSVESQKSPSTAIFLKGLSISTSEGRLVEAFSQFGEVSRVKIAMDQKTKQSQGFAFLWFTNEEAAKLAVKEMDGKFIDGRFVSVTIAKPGSCKVRRRETPYKF